ncbi:microtubule-associated tumor suppressor candidate 2 [Brachionichthys hirsutus]|uniref:microtubule-associated tumor suppressor candidate 2 n=1 Tax=Brachionichthys hirsutus TaxID=412623 RepID=UPI003604DBD9
MCEPGQTFNKQNNNQQEGVLANDDANANEIRMEDGGRTGDTGTELEPMAETAEQDKIIIWGTDSQCDDPDLAEFEMLECQELEAYLVEDGEDFVDLANRDDLQEQPSLCNKSTAGQTVLTKSKEESKSILHDNHKKEASASHVSESKEASRTELSSETDVFVSCLSNMSNIVMDNAGGTQTTDSWHIASGPYSSISEDPTLVSLTCNTTSERAKALQNTEHRPNSKNIPINQKDVDMNTNSAVHSENVVAQEQMSNGVVLSEDVNDEHRKNNNKRNTTGNSISEQDCDRKGSTEHKGLPTTNKSQDESNMNISQSTQDVVNCSPLKTDTKGTRSLIESKAKHTSFENSLKKQNSFDKTLNKQPSFENTLKKQLSFDNTVKKQGSFENTITTGSSSLERRKPWGSPSRPATPSSSKTTSCSPKRRPPGSPAKVQGIRALSLERSQTVKLPGKTGLSSAIPKPVIPQQKDPEPRRSSPPQKPKNVRPKIITYVRKTPQAKPHFSDASPDTSTLPMKVSSYCSPAAHRDLKAGPHPKATPVLCSSNLLLDKYRQEMQKADYYPPVMAVAGVILSSSPPRLGGKSDSFHEDMPKNYLQEVSQEVGSGYPSPRALRPQLGLGAVTRQPAAKTKVQQPGQRSAPRLNAQTRGVSAQGFQETAGERGTETTNKSLQLKPGQSGLRPPGFCTLPAARLAAYGFVRSSSVLSASNIQPSQYPGSGSDETFHKAPGPPSEASQTQSWSQPPNAPSLHRRSLPPQRSSPRASKREMQKGIEAVMPPKSSPKRFAVVPPKPQSPVFGQSAAVHSAVQTERAQELDRVRIQQLRERCEQQSLQLQSLQAQLKKASLCLDVFSITTQHFCHKSENAIVKERELSLELAKIRDEVAFSVAHWEQLQQEKQELERRFQAALQGLRAQQQRELGALEERLKARHMAETESLQAQQQSELEELTFKQQEQIEDMRESHETSLMEMEMTHNDTLATLQEEHARTVKNLKMAHEQQTKSLEEEFEKVRLSLQDQVDTLTFQNRSLRDRAKRFEEALRRSTDEQIVDALAPYKHIEKDLRSLKEVLEMKNQQIHQQEMRISELEKIQAEKNVYLEERLQVLQQQNEDLKERIDKNVAVSRQLSAENANLQVHVEKESNEKKRLSRNNEELLWRLQTGELSPRMSPSNSPIHRLASGPGSPARPHSYHQ